MNVCFHIPETFMVAVIANAISLRGMLIYKAFKKWIKQNETLCLNLNSRYQDNGNIR